MTIVGFPDDEQHENKADNKKVVNDDFCSFHEEFRSYKNRRTGFPRPSISAPAVI